MMPSQFLFFIVRLIGSRVAASLGQSVVVEDRGGGGSTAAELFKPMAGVDIVRINYKGARPAVNASFADEVQVMFPTAGVEVIGSSPERLTATMKSEIARLGKVIRDAGIKAD